ncbi:MAG: HD domain-containing protein [Ruminococcus sp.]|nr:HD domain-containing protein [Ruminococcus sp.]
MHNRFVHSLGVFHLGKKAIKSFKNNIKDINTSPNWDIWEETFILACLLHDVGHSPFSHTGEEFYNRSTDFISLFDEILDSPEFKKDIERGYGKPHEAMSAVVGYNLIKEHQLTSAIDKELFIRSIIGVKYSSVNDDSLILNTIIEMLNGSVIDVDKLDYLIRDTYVTGYKSIAIDIDRLLSGYTLSEYISEDNNKRNVAVYKKSALSVVESVAYANDLERRWIQNNPTVLYDCKLIEIAIKQYSTYITDTYPNLRKYVNVFNIHSISKDGYAEDEKIKIRLLSDDDIIEYLKNHDNSLISKQYFSRSERYKPLWKSEPEFSEVVKKELSARILREIKSLLRQQTSLPANPSDNQEELFFINEQYYKQRLIPLQNLKKSNEPLNTARYVALENNLKVYQLLRNFSNSNSYDFEFAIIFGNHFESNYKKLAINNIFVEVSSGKVIELGKTLTVNAIASTEEEQQGLFYIYTSRKNIYKAQSQNKNFTQEVVRYIQEHWDDKIICEE